MSTFPLGHVLTSSVALAYMNGLEMMSLSQTQQEQMHICNNTKHLYKKNRESAKEDKIRLD